MRPSETTSPPQQNVSIVLVSDKERIPQRMEAVGGGNLQALVETERDRCMFPLASAPPPRLDGTNDFGHPSPPRIDSGSSRPARPPPSARPADVSLLIIRRCAVAARKVCAG